MKYYKVILSNKLEVVLDEADYEKLLQGMNSGSFVRLKKAVVNPSFIVVIQPIKPKEALAVQEMPKVEGYIDEATRQFVITKDERPVVTELTDEFH